MHAATPAVEGIPRGNEQHLSDRRGCRVYRSWHRESLEQPPRAGIISFKFWLYDRRDANQSGEDNPIAQRRRSKALIEQTFPSDLAVPNIQRMHARFLKRKVTDIGAAAE